MLADQIQGVPDRIDERGVRRILLELIQDVSRLGREQRFH